MAIRRYRMLVTVEIEGGEPPPLVDVVDLIKRLSQGARRWLRWTPRRMSGEDADDHALNVRVVGIETEDTDR
jgi:hypothetical protein